MVVGSGLRILDDYACAARFRDVQKRAERSQVLARHDTYRGIFNATHCARLFSSIR